MAADDLAKCIAEALESVSHKVPEEIREPYLEFVKELEDVPEVSLSDVQARLGWIKNEAAQLLLKSAREKAVAKAIEEDIVIQLGFEKGTEDFLNAVLSMIARRQGSDVPFYKALFGRGTRTLKTPLYELRGLADSYTYSVLANAIEHVEKKYNLRGLSTGADEFWDEVALEMLGGVARNAEYRDAASEIAQRYREELQRAAKERRYGGMLFGEEDNYLERAYSADLLRAKRAEAIEFLDRNMDFSKSKYKTGEEAVDAMIRGEAKKVGQGLAGQRTIMDRKIRFRSPEAELEFIKLASGRSAREIIEKTILDNNRLAFQATEYGAQPLNVLRRVINQWAEDAMKVTPDKGKALSKRKIEARKARALMELEDVLGVSSEVTNTLIANSASVARNLASISFLMKPWRYALNDTIVQASIHAATSGEKVSVTREVYRSIVSLMEGAFKHSDEAGEWFLDIVGANHAGASMVLSRENAIERAIVIERIAETPLEKAVASLEKGVAKAADVTSKGAQMMMKYSLNEFVTNAQLRGSALMWKRSIEKAMSAVGSNWSMLKKEIPILAERAEFVGVTAADWRRASKYFTGNEIDFTAMFTGDPRLFRKLMSFIQHEAKAAINAPSYTANQWARGFALGAKKGSPAAYGISLALQFTASATQASLNIAELATQIYRAQGKRGVYRLGIPALGALGFSSMLITQFDAVTTHGRYYELSSPQLWANTVEKTGLIVGMTPIIDKAMTMAGMQSRPNNAGAIEVVFGPSGSLFTSYAKASTKLLGYPFTGDEKELRRGVEELLTGGTPFASAVGGRIAVNMLLDSMIGPDYARERRMRKYYDERGLVEIK